MTLEEKQQEYAKLLIHTGLNLQKGQPLVIYASVDSAPFARLCAEAAYEAGCREVVLRWRDDAMTRMTYMKADDAIFDEFPDWQKEDFDYYENQHAAYLAVHATDPENLVGIDAGRLQRASIAAGKATREHAKRQMRNDIPWCVAGIPCTAWAKKVFPDLSEDDAVNALWDAILKTVYVGGEKSAEEAWEDHIQTLRAAADKLNLYQFESLHYQNALGTDLTVGLCENHRWEGGADTDSNGVRFVANMPTEEIFTAPKRDAVNGVVYASKPLCYQGTLIENIRFTLKDGKIIKAEATTGLDVLQNAISVDKGASYFGEAALVANSSPLSKLGILFYDTLYDENAACHFAFGEAYPCLQNAASLSEEELRQAGLNESDVHVDFMIGTPDLSVTGRLKDGNEIAIMQNGEFVL